MTEKEGEGNFGKHGMLANGVTYEMYISMTVSFQLEILTNQVIGEAII